MVIFGVVLGMCFMAGIYVWEEAVGYIPAHVKEYVQQELEEVYDPNAPEYRWIPEAPSDWTGQFGANERTRLLHAISELRAVVAAQGKRLLALEAQE
jgi:hypothetical protein